MSTKIISNGNVTSPKGFLAGAVFAGLKSPGKDKKISESSTQKIFLRLQVHLQKIR